MNPIAEAYNADVQREWNRLAKDAYHTLEFQVTWHYLKKHLPPHGRILDAGGGPGRYSLELCRASYEVVLMDISSGLIALAQEKFKSEPEGVQSRLLEFAVGDIQDLSRFETNHFDAVVCLGGPLTHISAKSGRFKAMAELVRVAKSGATIFVSVMGHLAVLRTIAAKYSDDLLNPSFQGLVETGDNFVSNFGAKWHFFRADELQRLAEQCGLKTIEMAGCEGLSANLAEGTNLLAQDEVKWKRWTELVLKTSAEPAVVDMAEHILYVGQKRQL
jgi:ubiquinone/menaquinone biosynthesis C-methylase UbiE